MPCLAPLDDAVLGRGVQDHVDRMDGGGAGLVQQPVPPDRALRVCTGERERDREAEGDRYVRMVTAIETGC